jgi:O-antigen/teichoic acid export membrane protein
VSAHSNAIAVEEERSNHGVRQFAREALVRNVWIDMAARAGYLLTRVLIPPFVLSHIGLDAYSLWAAVFVFVAYAGATTIGVSAAYVKYVADYAARGEAHKSNTLLSTGFVTVGAASLVAFGLVVLGLGQVLSWLHMPAHLQHEARIVVLLVASSFLFDFAFSMFRDSLAGAQKIAEVQIIWVASYLIETALIVVLLSTGHGVIGLADAFVVRMMVSAVLSVVMAYRLLPWIRISIRWPSREALGQLVRFGGVVQFVAILGTVLNTVERAIALPLVGLSAVGLLDISDKLPGMAAIIPTALATSLFPAAAYLRGGFSDNAEGRQVITDLYFRGTRYMSLIAGAIAGLLATSAAPLMAVWLGKVYPGTVYLMAIFAIQQHFHVMTGPGTAILKGIGRPREELFYSVPNIVAVIVLMPLTYLVLGRWSIVGLGSAVALATAVSATGFIFHVNRILQVRWRRFVRYVLLPGVVPYIVGTVFIVPASLATHGGRWRGAAIIAIVGALYALTLTVVLDFTVLDDSERQSLRNVLRRESRRLGQLIRSNYSL